MAIYSFVAVSTSLTVKESDLLLKELELDLSLYLTNVDELLRFL